MPPPPPPDRPKSKSLQPLRALAPYLQPYRGVLALALGALLVAAAAMLALPIALRYLIDEGLTAGHAETIDRYFVAFLAAAAVYRRFCGAAVLSRDVARRARDRRSARGRVCAA